MVMRCHGNKMRAVLYDELTSVRVRVGIKIRIRIRVGIRVRVSAPGRIFSHR